MAEGWTGREEERRGGEKGGGEKKEMGEKERVEKIGNWSGSDDLSKSRERLISYIVATAGRRRAASRLRSSTVARVRARARLAGRRIRARRRAPREIQFAGNGLRGASRKPVEPDKLVIEQRIFLSFSGEVAPAVCPARPDCPHPRGSDIVYDT